MTRAKDISKILTDADISGTLDATGIVTANAGIKVDNITIDGTEIDLSSGDLTVDVAGDISLDADGGQIRVKDGGTEFGVFSNVSSDFIIASQVQDKDIIFQGDDGGSGITALTLDMSDAGTAIFNHDIKLSANAIIDCGGNLRLDTESASVVFQDAGTVYGNIFQSSSDFVIKSETNDKDIIFQGFDGGSSITALTLDMSEAGDATFNNRAIFNNNVSIGTTSFPSKFTVSNAGTDNIIETANTTNSVRGGMQADTSIVGMGAITNHALVFRQNNTERMRIHTNGNVSMQNTDNQALLKIYGHLQSYNGLMIQNGTNNTGGLFVSFRKYDNVTIGSVSQNNSAVSFNTSSDYRLKESITYDFDATTRLKQLKPARFNWIADETNTLVDGFLAHEVSDIVPEAITGTKDDTQNIGTVKDKDGNIIDTNISEAQYAEGKKETVDSDGNKKESLYPSTHTWEKTGSENVYQQIDHSKLVPLLVKTIQELEARITALESA